MSSAQLRSLLLILLSFIYNFVVSDALVNVTIDDSLTSLIQYTPASSWDDTIVCSGSAASLNAAQAHNSTWHRSTYEPGTGDGDLPLATVHFDGKHDIHRRNYSPMLSFSGWHRDRNLRLLRHIWAIGDGVLR